MRRAFPARLSFQTIRPITGGWAYFTFDLDGLWIARFPRTAEIAAATRRELKLLPVLSQRMSFEVPTPRFVGAWSGWPFFVYERIAGRALVPEDLPTAADGLAHLLKELHSFPISKASTLLGVPGTVEGWRDRYRHLWRTLDDIVVPLLDSRTARRLEAAYHHFVDGRLDFEPSLVHNDLGPAHILIDDGSRSVVGVIDFEDATVGDPAIDLVWLHRMSPPRVVNILFSEREWGPDLDRRLWFYDWMGSVHAIIYGVREGDDNEVRDGLTGLQQRLGVSG